MVNYSNGKIYKIVCDTSNLIYVGSTTKEFLSQRLVEHRCNYDRWKRGVKQYATSYKVLEHNTYNIVLLETVKCNTKDELSARERFYIDSLVCVNKQLPLQTKQEYRDANKESIAEYKKEYRDANRDEINKKQKEYQQKNKDEINKKQKEYRDSNRDELNKKQKEWWEKNKVELHKKQKEYRDTNKDEINKKAREKRAAKKIAYMELYPHLFPK